MNKMATILLISLASLLGCVKEEDKVLATVGTEEIKVKDFLAVYVPKTYPDNEAELEAKKKILDGLIDQKLLLAEAKRRGYDKDPALADSLRLAYQEGLVEALYKSVVLNKVKVNEGEVKRMYRADMTLLHLKAIQVASDTLANTVYKKYAEGVPFDSLAAIYSQHPSSRQGGDIGTISLAGFFNDQNTFRQLSALKPGTATKPIKNPFGTYDILYLVERTERENPPGYDEVKETYRRRLERLKERELADASFKRFMEQSNIEYNQQGLDIFTKPKRDVAPQELGIWTVKVNGEVKDSVGSMMLVYSMLRLDDTTGAKPEQIRQLAEGFGTNAAFAEIAKKRHLDHSPVVQERVDNTLERMITNRLYQEEIAGKVSVTPEEVRSFYDEHLADIYTIPEQRKLYIIRNSEYSQIQQASSLLAQGTSFGEVAERFSDHEESASRGGFIGFKDAKDVNFKHFVEKAFTMRKGQTSEPFPVYNGWGIVMVDDIKEGRVMPFEEVEASIQRRLERDRERARRDEFLTTLRTPVEINEELLLSVGKAKEQPRSNETKSRP